MSEWLSVNWFQVLTLLGIAFSWAVHYGISTAKWKAMADKVDEIEATLEAIQTKFDLHTQNGLIHVSPTLLQLFDERSDYVKQQFADTRNDISRIENMIATLGEKATRPQKT